MSTQTLQDQEGTATAAASDTVRSRTRWAGIIWGLVLAGAGVLGIRLASDAGLRQTLSSWIWSQSPATTVLWSVLLLGALVVICALVGVAGAVQQRLRKARSASAAGRVAVPIVQHGGETVSAPTTVSAPASGTGPDES